MTEETNIPAATITVGLPPGISADAVLARKKALIAAGTDHLLADRLAIECEVQQARRNALNEEIDKAMAAKAAAGSEAKTKKEAK